MGLKAWRDSGAWGVALGIAKLLFTFALIAISVDGDSSTGTRIVAALFAIFLGLDAKLDRIASLLERQETRAQQQRSAELLDRT